MVVGFRNEELDFSRIKLSLPWIHFDGDTIIAVLKSEEMLSGGGLINPHQSWQLLRKLRRRLVGSSNIECLLLGD